MHSSRKTFARSIGSRWIVRYMGKWRLHAGCSTCGGSEHFYSFHFGFMVGGGVMGKNLDVYSGARHSVYHMPAEILEFLQLTTYVYESAIIMVTYSV